MDNPTVHRLLADLVLLLHWGVVLFTVVGLLLIFVGGWRGWAWVRRPGWRCLHLLCIGIVVVQAWLGVLCPLTTLEMALRQRAGDAVYASSFVAHWLGELLYIQAPWWVFTTIYSAFGAIVLGSWFWVRPVRQGKATGEQQS